MTLAIQTEEAVSPLQIEVNEEALIARLPKAWPVLSWAPWRGGDVISDALINRRVFPGQTCRDVNNALSFEDAFARLGLSAGTVAFLTAADVRKYQQTVLSRGPLWVHAIATVGLTNARAIGDSADVDFPKKPLPAGTINLWVATNALPDLAGRIEAAHTATAAKVAAVRDVGVLSKKSGLPAAGTGTDCIAIAASGELSENHAGMHTALGELIGKAVYEVIKDGIAIA